MGTREETREEVDEQPSHMIPVVHVCRRSGLGPCTHVRVPKPDLRGRRGGRRPLWCAGFAPEPSWVAAQERKEPAVV